MTTAPQPTSAEPCFTAHIMFTGPVRIALIREAERQSMHPAELLIALMHRVLLTDGLVDGILFGTDED